MSAETFLASGLTEHPNVCNDTCVGRDRTSRRGGEQMMTDVLTTALLVSVLALIVMVGVRKVKHVLH